MLPLVISQSSLTPRTCERWDRRPRYNGSLSSLHFGLFPSQIDKQSGAATLRRERARAVSLGERDLHFAISACLEGVWCGLGDRRPPCPDCRGLCMHSRRALLDLSSIHNLHILDRKRSWPTSLGAVAGHACCSAILRIPCATTGVELPRMVTRLGNRRQWRQVQSPLRLQERRHVCFAPRQCFL